jgi:hypothetical protein
VQRGRDVPLDEGKLDCRLVGCDEDMLPDDHAYIEQKFQRDQRRADSNRNP